MTDNVGHFVFCEVRQDGEECHDGEDDPTEGVNEGGRLDEHERSGSHQTDDRETQHTKRLLVIGVALKLVFQPEIRPAHAEHDDEARQDDGEGGEDASPYTGGGVSDVGGTVDPYRSRSDLTHRHDIDELLLRHPSVTLHLHLNQR